MMGQEHIQNFNLRDGVRIVIADTMLAGKGLPPCACTSQVVVYFEKYWDPDLDALVIATPNFHHIDVLRPALETGKPILCEKPLCTSLDDTREILTRVSSGKQIFQVGMEYRFKPALADMIARVDAGDVGRLQCCRSASIASFCGKSTIESLQRKYWRHVSRKMLSLLI